ncbi:hypothetical protein [Pseudonocardia sp. D17]|uniref:hypothetical protein n=1 Tax=Pseudonocardia sp. D17 TaxID=882661 RepID=UPI002B3DD590|nr:hypothetical protein PSD17_56550 [Pseudonocardia sp. D17]
MPHDLTAAYAQTQHGPDDPDPRAAVVVASFARDVEDARLLLDALGLDRAAVATSSALLKLARRTADPAA